MSGRKYQQMMRAMETDDERRARHQEARKERARQHAIEHPDPTPIFPEFIAFYAIDCQFAAAADNADPVSAGQ